MSPLRPLDQSRKLKDVLYEIRGQALVEADRLEADGHRILKLNTGNPATFGFEAPYQIVRDMIEAVPHAHGYSDSRGIMSARRAVVSRYEQVPGFPAFDPDDVYLGNGVSELITMTMQALVMAHACFGHNHFFKNNYLFRQWTDADGILPYLDFSKKYIAKCEDEYGAEEVEAVLDAAHSLMDQGVFRYNRPPRLSDADRLARIAARIKHEETNFNDIWRTLPNSEEPEDEKEERQAEVRNIQLPEENLLYFIAKKNEWS